MLLSRLTQGLTLDDRVGRDVEIRSLTCDTRTLLPGGLFVALRGEQADGNQFLAEALAKGAAVVVRERPSSDPGAGPWLFVDNAREAYAILCANWFRNPAAGMTLLAVTGTNGKTTTTYLLKTILEQVLGAKVGLVGTNQNLIGQVRLPAQRTTPEPYALHGLLAQMKEAGCSHVVMEASSHALSQGRLTGLTFAGGIFTNLTREHLDYHGTLDAYFAAKARLFHQCRQGFFHLDDPAGAFLAKTAPCPGLGFGWHCPAGAEPGLWAEDVVLRPDGVRFTACTAQERHPVRLGIPGGFSVSNALGALACCVGLGLSLAACAGALGSVVGVKGRMETVPVPAPYTVVIDYAHTPDALEQVLRTLRATLTEQSGGRLLCLFGCGGDRDKTKRPLMGSIAATLADFIVLTSDNPRTEDPEAILHDIAAGFPPDFTRVHIDPDRKRAIRHLLTLATPGDILLLAGKGHETTQTFGGREITLDEREEIASFFGGNGV